VDQQTYDVFKAVKHFRSYLLKSRTKVVVPYPVVRILLVQNELGEKRENWMTSLQEYDLGITLALIVRGQGLCKVVVDLVHELEIQINTSTINQHNQKQINCAQTTPNSWYENIRFYLMHGYAPHNLEPKNRRELRLKSASFQLINDILFRKKFDGFFLRCLEKEESEKVLVELHSGDVGGHFGGDTTAHKVLRAAYYWPTLFKDAHALSWKCVICQKVAGWVKKEDFPLQHVTVDAPFQQWGIDIIGPNNPLSS
jgi:hypothetical protein